jgi:EgtB-related family protein
MSEPRRLAGAALAAALGDSRQRTLSLVDDLSDAQWQVPQQNGINPIAWELCHLAWFAEFWILRGPHRVGDDGFVRAAKPARIAGPDATFDSSRLAHAERWHTPLPSRQQVSAVLAAQLDACLEAMPGGDDDEALYFHRLALFHEDMHGEALVWLRSSLGYGAPNGASLRTAAKRAPLFVPAGRVVLGWPAGERGFAFDNELPGQSVELPGFEIDAQPITAGQFLRFVEAGGRPPLRWRQVDGHGWQVRWFDRWLPLAPDAPVIHVNAFEAEAYCDWAGRSLPSAAQWQRAATLPSDAAFRWGDSVWEWTADAFQPYVGFSAGPYKDYSAPWFGSHRELRGGAFATHARMHDVHYRNFFVPQRSDVFAGFRTVSRGA